MTRPTLLERFWAKVDKSAGPDGCWIWTGTKIKGGYGQIGLHGRKRIYVHRLSLEIANGTPVPADKMACHHCDNPPCVNPAHLYVGTAQSNVDDMWARDRANRLGVPRPDAAARLTRLHNAERGYSSEISQDIEWWNAESHRVALREAVAHVERVIRGDGLDTNVRWLSLPA